MSCSQNLPETKTVNTMTIFDFANENDFPSARLSFFVETSSLATRAGSIEVHSKKYGYYWKTDSVIKIASSKRQWVGYSNFAFPENLAFPDGDYIVKYIQADGEQSETKAFVSFDAKFLSAKAEEIPSLMEEKGGRHYAAVFDRDNNLIIYGEKAKNLRSEESILRKYHDAFYYRDVWTSGNNSMLCLLPIKYLKQ